MATTKPTASKIVGIQFSILSPEEIRKGAVTEITSRDTYIGSKPVLGGLFCPYMGVSERNAVPHGRTGLHANPWILWPH